MPKSMERKVIDAMIRNGLTDKQFSPSTFGRVMSIEPYEVQDSFIQSIGFYIYEMGLHVESGFRTADNIHTLANNVKSSFPSSGQGSFNFD